MWMTKSGTAAVLVLVLLLAGCSFPKNPSDKAEWFFEKGHDKIVDSLEDQGVEGEAMERVKAVLAEHRSPVVSDLTVAFAEQRTSFKTLYSGADTSSLLSTEDQASRAKRDSLRSIGAMHADIEGVVGEDTWAAANAQRRQDFEDRFGE